MDCVFHAYCDHLGWLGIQATPSDRLHWHILKWWTHGNQPQYTFGGVAPWILAKMAAQHGLRLRMEHRVYTPYHHLAVARYEYPTRFKRLALIIEATDFGPHVEHITLAPAIYLLLTGQHAVFSESVPVRGVPVAAIQLYKKGF